MRIAFPDLMNVIGLPSIFRSFVLAKSIETQSYKANKGSLDMSRIHNFYAGPAVLPYSVVQETKAALDDFAGLGTSIMEVSHRSKEFESVITEAQRDTLAIMGLSEQDYSVIFIGGGASTQFAMVPMNFLHAKADYVVTGEWAKKAAKEARLFGNVNEAGSSADANFNYIPKQLNWQHDADYAHITTNNTIYGTEWKTTPEVGNVPLIADMSSNMLGRRYDFAKYSLIYAGAQKNLGPAGVTMVVLKKAWMEERAKIQIPTMLKYKTHAEKGSMFNTPPVLPVYVVGRTLKWIIDQGGLDAVQSKNERKAKLIYDVIDACPEFYKGTVTDKQDRSLMNLTWNLPSEELEAKFVAEAKAQRMLGLKGHRSVGGIRASLYNACPLESAEALARFMEKFYADNK